MPRGGPDWGIGANRAVAGISADPGEAAARLGSPVTYTRTGTVIWLDDFEFGLEGWNRSVVGTGAAINLVTSPVYRGRFACKMIGGSTGSGIAQMTKGGWAVAPQRVGIEVVFAAVTVLKEFLLEIDLPGKNGGILFDLLVKGDADQLAYFDSAGNDQVIASYDLLTGTSNTFNVLKLVADLDEGEYVRAYFNDKVYDLAGIAGFPYASTQEAYLNAFMQVTSEAGRNDEAVVDSVIFTANEP